MNYVTKTLCALFALTLIGFASLQFNDPDPVVWVSCYLICAAVPGMVLFDKFFKPVFWAAIVICLVEASRTGAGAYNYYLHMAEEPLMQAMNPEKPYIEEAREFGGSLIALSLVLISAWFYSIRMKK